MSYNFSTKLTGTSFDEAIEMVTGKLKEQGFGILTEIDVKETFKKKLDVDFRKYKILGACNPNFAHKAIKEESNIGVFLPCNVIVQEHENGDVEIAAVDPVASMQSVENDNLGSIASEVKERLITVVENLKN